MSEAKVPEDHKKPAAQAEAEGEDVTVEHKDKKYVLPGSPEDWPVKAARAYENDRGIDASAFVLESRGYDADALTTRDLVAIFKQYGEIAGFAEGE